ncbi:MAG: M48 family metallopeptidase [Clostridia bacterium]|nr:M48 family metallopeptidase [Clostridia bacterium]
MPEKLHDISVDDFTHPDDLAAIQALHNIPAVDRFVSNIEDQSNQIIIRMTTLGSCVRLTDANAAHVCEIVRNACDIIGYGQMPEIYTRRAYSLDVFPSGVERPVIVIPDLALRTLNDDLLYFTVGRALTRFKSDYLKFYLVAQLMITSSSIFPVVSDVVKLPLVGWMRKSELTADRGGLLVCQNYKAAMRFLMCKAGMPYKETAQVSIPDYIEASQTSNTLTRAGKEAKTVLSSTGWINDRINELFLWYAKGSYDDLLEEYL